MKNETTLVVALHGNPGNPADFASLAEALALPDTYEVACPAPAIKTIDQTVASHTADNLVLIAYSWGAYSALAWLLSTRPAKPLKAVLINPMLVVVHELSPLTKTLISIPGLSKQLISRGLGERVERFIVDTFSPETAPEELHQVLRERLLNRDIWLAAAQNKLMQSRFPLCGSLSVPVLVVRGVEDQVAHNPVQEEVLSRLGVIPIIHDISGAGHSLLWTHQQETVSAIREFLFMS